MPCGRVQLLAAEHVAHAIGRGGIKMGGRARGRDRLLGRNHDANTRVLDSRMGCGVALSGEKNGWWWAARCRHA